MSAILEAINLITDTKYYKDKVNGHLLEVFPKDIPTNAEEVNFFYSPDFLQGGSSIALYYIDKDMTIDKFDEKYKFKAEWVGYFEDYNDKDGLLTGAFLNTPAQYNNENDYIIYLVNSRCDNSGYCNHGNFLFTSFNKNTNEIIFKSENW